MKTQRHIHCFLATSLASLFLIVHSALAQNSPTLSVQLYAGVSISGATGSIYAVQVSNDLGNSYGWSCADLVLLSATNLIWADTSKNASGGQRFYRAVLTATNLVSILPGTFTMGSPTNEALRQADEVQHVVTITKGFYMDKFLVTQSEYLAVVGSNPSFYTGNLNYPVEGVSWHDATNYCNLRTAQERAAGLIPTNWVYRLPTESEWEYACRAGTVTAFYLGSSLHSQQANFIGTNEYDAAIGNIYNPSGQSVGTSVGGNYAPNGWGLYDMAGNVGEWCQDFYAPYPLGNVTDPRGPLTGMTASLRGGDFHSGAVGCRSARRSPLPTTLAKSQEGFRVVLSQQ